MSGGIPFGTEEEAGFSVDEASVDSKEAANNHVESLLRCPSALNHVFRPSRADQSSAHSSRQAVVRRVPGCLLVQLWVRENRMQLSRPAA